MRRPLPVRASLALTCLLAGHATASAPAGAQQRATPVRATVVLAIPGDVTTPLPVIGPGFTHSTDVADQLFLRLGFLKSTFQTIGDNALSPMLARSWRRIDPRTIVFELDPRARWHDGAPVTAGDVAFTWRLMTNPRVGSDRAVVEPIESVDSLAPHRVRVRFRRTFREQLYLAGFNFQPLPAHLLARMPAESIATSEYARHPVGNGPFRYERRVAGEFIELRADSTFFLGKPGIARVVFRVIGNPATKLTMLLNGELDVMDNLPPAAVIQARARPDLRVATFTSNLIVYARFNARAPGDSARTHSVLSDRRVRSALIGALDRRTMARNAFGPNAAVPDAVQSVTWNWVAHADSRRPRDVAGARAMLAQAGWRDSDADGILDRAGVPLRVGILYPSTSSMRNDFAVQMQAMWRDVGVDAHLERVEGPVYGERRMSGRFDIDVTAVNQDPSPMSLVQSWSCAAAAEARSSNTAHWCDAEFDRLVSSATAADNPTPGYRRALARMASEAPAIFLAAPYNQVALHARYENVQIWPIKAWTSLWQWRVRPGAELPRDR